MRALALVVLADPRFIWLSDLKTKLPHRLNTMNEYDSATYPLPNGKNPSFSPSLSGVNALGMNRLN